MQRRGNAPWSVDLALEIDRAVPGFCGAFLRASGERRQVITAYLAAKPPHQEQMADTGRFLLAATHRAILVAAFDEPIARLRGALRRAGDTTHDRRFYLLLRRLLARPRHQQVKPVLARLSSLTTLKLRILHLLPETICHVAVVECIKNLRHAFDLAIAYRLLVSRGVNEAELASAIVRVRDVYGYARVFDKQLLKCNGVVHPVPASEHYRPICSARELQAIARTYHNCARNHLVDLLEEAPRRAFAEVIHGGEGAVVHLTREGSQWRLEELVGPRNARVSRAMRSCVHRHLTAHGVIVTSRDLSASEWTPLRRIIDLEDIEADHDESA